jgi:hypothetical protein
VHALLTSGRPSDIGSLVRLADQAFGSPQPAEEEEPSDNFLAQLNREERAALLALLDEGVPDAPPAEMDESELS